MIQNPLVRGVCDANLADQEPLIFSSRVKQKTYINERAKRASSVDGWMDGWMDG